MEEWKNGFTINDDHQATTQSTGQNNKTNQINLT